MDTDRAYIYGLLIGGADFGNSPDCMVIKLPYRQWASSSNPERVAQLSKDILGFIRPLMGAVYGLNVRFEPTERIWSIICEGDLSELKKDLLQYGIKCEGYLRNRLPIKNIIPHLVDQNLKRRFIAGLADSIGSTNPTHRRFSEELQILSFELNGFNFEAVCALCGLLYSVGCIPDQVLWNHPNFHTSKNPYDKRWKKGFKLRVALDQYAEFGAFCFRTKTESMNENRQLQESQHKAEPCEEKHIHASVSAIHEDEHSIELPPSIRGGHYIHFSHVCAVLGCKHAPYEALRKSFSDIGKLINPFPILCKDSAERITELMHSSDVMSKVNYERISIHPYVIVLAYQNNSNALMYGDGEAGYPASEMLQAIAYLIADEAELNGKRPRKSYMDLILRHLEQDPGLLIEMLMPNVLAPIAMFGNGRGALIGPRNPKVYESLVKFDPNNPYKLITRKIEIEDL